MFYIQDSKIHGKGIFTSKPLIKGEELFLVGDTRLIDNYRQQNDAWITRQGRMVNHQKKGNCVLVFRKECYYLFACKNIEANEELTCDYTQVPSPPFRNNIEGFIEENELRLIERLKEAREKQQAVSVELLMLEFELSEEKVLKYMGAAFQI